MRAGYDLFQIKYDGIWGEVRNWPGVDFNTPAVYEIFSRTGNSKLQATHPTEPIAQGVLLAEYMFGSQWSQHPSRKGNVYCYDLLEIGLADYRNSTYAVRFRAMVQYLATLKNQNFKLVQCYPIEKLKFAWDKNLESSAYEGFILRNWNSLYGDRSIGKIKRTVTDDFVVMGMQEGEGKHQGRMGSLVLGQYNDSGQLVQVMNCGGGFSDVDRAWWWTHLLAPAILEHTLIAEVIGKGRMDSGALRHPNFLRIRTDKLPLECKLKTSL